MRFVVSFVFMLLSMSIAISTVSAENIQGTNPETSVAALFSEEKDFNRQELIIKFEPNTTEKEKQAIFNTYQLTEKSSLKWGDISLATVSEQSDLKSVANMLLHHKQVKFVEPNIKVEASYTPKDPGYSKQWYLKKIGMPKAWDVTKGSSKVTVAVIDGGVQVDHPELKGKIVYPYDIVKGKTTFKGDHHGTHVAGIIAASFNNKGIAGIAPNVKIMPINVFQGSAAEVFDIVEAVYYAVYFKADIINMSLVSYQYSEALEEATDFANSEGVVVVAAAGNEDISTETYPAAYHSVMAVSATNSNDRISRFSNYGTYIDFAAPGEDIYSTNANSSYVYMNGTSMAAPVVSGISALVLSKNPFLTPKQVKSILGKSALDLGLKGWDPLYGYGRVDAYQSLKLTPDPIKSLSVGSSTFKMTGKNKNTFSFYPFKGTTVSFYMKNSKGTVVKKFFSNKKSTGSKMTSSWDGKLSNGSYAPNGTYELVVKVTNGKKTVYKKKKFKVVNQIVPVITLDGTSSSFSPEVSGKIKIPFTLNKGAKVTAKVYDRSGKHIRTIWSSKSLSGGKHNLYWKGTNKYGKVVADGSYKITLSVVDSQKVKGKSKNLTVKVDQTSPYGKLTLSGKLYQIGVTENISSKLTLKENVTLTASVIDETGKVVRKLATNKTVKPSEFTLVWDGKNDSKELVSEGKYKYQVVIKDSLGNAKTITSSEISVEDPIIISSTDVIYKIEGDLEIAYTLSQAGQVEITIFKDDILVRSISNELRDVGRSTFSWNGKDVYGNTAENGTYTFKITLRNDSSVIKEFVGNIHLEKDVVVTP